MKSELPLDFPFVAELPKRETKRVLSKWELVDKLREAFHSEGLLLPVNLAADCLNMSRQRIWQIVQDGRLTRVEVAGNSFITERSVRALAETERVTGRPLKKAA